MKGVLGKLGRALDILAEGLVGLMIVALVAMVFQSVIGRYFLKASDIYTQEFTQFLYPWIVFVGMAIVYKAKSHIAVTFFVGRLPRRARQYIELGQTILTGVFFAFLLVIGLSLSMITRDQFTSTLALRKTWFYFSVPVGAIFTLRYVVDRLVEQISQLRGGTRS